MSDRPMLPPLEDERTAYILQPHIFQNNNRFGYFITKGTIGGEVVAQAEGLYQGNNRGFAIFMGETLDIPDDVHLTFTGDLKEVKERVGQHMHHIARCLADES